LSYWTGQTAWLLHTTDWDGFTGVLHVDLWLLYTTDWNGFSVLHMDMWLGHRLVFALD